MNQDTATPTEVNTLRSGASFLDILASAASVPAQLQSPSAGTQPRISLVGQHDSQANDSKTGNQSAANDASSDASQGQSQNAQSTRGLVIPLLPGTLPVAAAWPTRVKATGHAAWREDKPQLSSTHLAAKITASVVLPPATLLAAAAAGTALPALTLPIAAPAVTDSIGKNIVSAKGVDASSIPMATQAGQAAAILPAGDMQRAIAGGSTPATAQGIQPVARIEETAAPVLPAIAATAALSQSAPAIQRSAASHGTSGAATDSAAAVVNRQVTLPPAAEDETARSPIAEPSSTFCAPVTIESRTIVPVAVAANPAPVPMAAPLQGARTATETTPDSTTNHSVTAPTTSDAPAVVPDAPDASAPQSDRAAAIDADVIRVAAGPGVAVVPQPSVPPSAAPTLAEPKTRADVDGNLPTLVSPVRLTQPAQTTLQASPSPLKTIEPAAAAPGLTPAVAVAAQGRVASSDDSVPVQQPHSAPGPDNANSQPAQGPSAPAAQAPSQNAVQNAQAAPAESTSAQTISASAQISAAVIPVNVSSTTPANVVLPKLGLIPGMADGTRSARMAMADSKPSTTVQSKISNDAIAAGSAKSNVSRPAAATASDSSRSNGNSSSSPQRSQPDGTQPAATAQKPADATAPAAPAIAAPAAQHSAASAPSRADATPDAARSQEQALPAQGNESATASGINTARVLQNMNESEMHVGMRSAEFGEISIRTMVSSQQMTAQISVDHSDLGKTISSHLPAMQEKLGELGVRATVEVSQSGMQFSGDRGYSAPREQKGYTQQLQGEASQPAAETEYAGMRVPATIGDGTRLDIRA